MSTVITITENFPVSVFQYLEMKFKGLRNHVMGRAAELAEEDAGAGAAVYTVQEEHVDRALRQIVSNRPNSQELLQLSSQRKSNAAASTENFPVSVFQYLEMRFKRLRNDVMEGAAELARDEAAPGATIYTVREEHVDRALKEIVSNRPKSQELLQVA